MKTHPALGLIEFADIAVGMQATDAMLKKAPIGFVRAGTITAGRYLTLVGGTPASVGEAVREGLAWGGESVVDHVVLADVHPRLFEGLLGRRRTEGAGSLGIVETETVAANVRAAEAALKGTQVELVEIRPGEQGLHGKGVSVFRGELHDVEAALAIAVAALEETGRTAVTRIVSSPHEATTAQLVEGTSFATATLASLDGEDG
jgi:microcompartment protein CcmL/EutN